jgi:hypothetical protein
MHNAELSERLIYLLKIKEKTRKLNPRPQNLKFKKPHKRIA